MPEVLSLKSQLAADGVELKRKVITATITNASVKPGLKPNIILIDWLVLFFVSWLLVGWLVGYSYSSQQPTTNNQPNNSVTFSRVQYSSVVQLFSCSVVQLPVAGGQTR